MQEDIGIVLRSAPYQERDRLLHLLTEKQGRIAGIAKGAIHSRRFGGSFDLFNCIEFRYSEKAGRELVRIDAATVKYGFPGIRTSLERIGAAGYFADLCLRLTEERHPARDVYVLLAHYLFLLDHAGASPEIVRSFEIKLLDRLGYSPILHQCVACGESLLADLKEGLRVDFALSVEQGGVLCSRCEPLGRGRRLSREALIWIQVVRATSIQKIPELQYLQATVNQGANFLHDFLRYHCPGMDQYNFRSHALLEEFMAGGAAPA